MLFRYYTVLFSILSKKTRAINCWNQKETCHMNKLFHTSPQWSFFHFHLKQLSSCQKWEVRSHGMNMLVRIFKSGIIWPKKKKSNSAPLLNVFLFSGSTISTLLEIRESRIYLKELSLYSCWTRSCDAIKYDAKLKLLSHAERQCILVLAHAVPLQAQNLGEACLCLHGICQKIYTVREI